VRSLADLERVENLWVLPEGATRPSGIEAVTDPSRLDLHDEAVRHLTSGGFTIWRYAPSPGAPLPASLEAAFPIYRVSGKPDLLVLGTRGLTVHLATTSVTEARRVLGSLGLVPGRRYRFGPHAWAATIPAGEHDPVAFAARLAKGRPAGVLAVSPVLVWPGARREDCYQQQWQHHGRNPGTLTEVTVDPTDHAFVEQAWKIFPAPRGRGVRIAVIDEAFVTEKVNGEHEVTHPNLEDAVLPATSGGFFPTSSGPVAFVPGIGGLSPSGAEQFHGTRCAGMAAARPSGKCACSGVAPAADLMLYALGKKVTCESMAAAITCAAEPALYFDDAAPGDGADVLSISYQCPAWVGEVFPPATIEDVHPVLQALRFAASCGRQCRGCVVLYAAENVDVPLTNDIVTQSPHLMVVGQSNPLGKSGDAYGAALAFVAPGSSVYVTSSGDDYDCYWCDVATGTSYATALAAGIAALVLGLWPRLSATGLKKLLLASCDQVGGVTYDDRGHNPHYGFGRINALTAVKRALRSLWRSWLPL
jgi:thermitase